MKTQTLLTSAEVAERAGVSYRRIDYWTRQGFIAPIVAAAGHGSQRLFDVSVLDEIDERLAGIAACPNCCSR